MKDVRFLDFCDGGFYATEDLITAVAQTIGEFQPDVIFAPDPDSGSECHPDHRTVGEIAKELAQSSANPGIMARYGAQASEVQALALGKGKPLCGNRRLSRKAALLRFRLS